MSKLSLLEIAQSQLDKTPVIDGQLIVCLDTGNAYRDTTTAHVKIGSDLEVVSDLPLAPLAEKIYYLKPDKLYAYLGGNWTLLNDNNFSLGANKSALNGKAKILLDGAKQSSVWIWRGKHLCPEERYHGNVSLQGFHCFYGQAAHERSDHW